MPNRARLVAAAVAAAAFTTALAAGKPKKAATPAAPPVPAVTLAPAALQPPAGSCAVPAKARCTDYAGAFAGTDPKADCARAGGTWRDGPCPAEGRVGTCTQREVGTDARVLLRVYAPAKADEARRECTQAPRAVFMPR